MDIKKQINLPVRTDRYGLYIYDNSGKVLAQVRGFGWLKALVGEEEAPEMQKELADWLVERINGKYYYNGKKQQ